MNYKNIYPGGIIFVFFKKHYCPDCGTLLERWFDSKVVNSRSPEAKNYDFGMGDGYRMYGDVEFRTAYLHCHKCGKNISYADMKVLEKHIKKP